MQLSRRRAFTRALAAVSAAGAIVAGQPAAAGAQPGPAAPRAGQAAVPPAPDALAQARTLYNEGRYRAAMEAAEQALPDHGAAAALLLGRAGLEHYRTTADPADLARARVALRSVDPAVLSNRDRIDLVIGLGEALYFDEHYRAAADLFESMLDEVAALGPVARDQLLDWWGTAIDRYVRGLPEPERAEAFDRLIARMEQELRRDPASAAAAYWVAAAAFARGHVDRAWNAAVAGWVRGLLTADRGAALRPDLDRLVRDAIIPERLRRLPAGSVADPQQAEAAMIAEWDLVKERWTKR